MKIAIGSTNPVKVNAAELALKNIFKDAEFVGLEVESQVGAQPIGDKETIRGAINRAKAALKQTGADLGVGLEGGIIHTEHGIMSSAWCAIIDKGSKISLGGGMHFHLPLFVETEILKGKELGEIMDELSGQKNVKKKMGAVGVMTAGLLTRTKEYAHLVKLAMVKFRSPQWFA